LRTTREACVSGGIAIDPRDFSSARHEFIVRRQPRSQAIIAPRSS
jgi:hypothetical protein